MLRTILRRLATPLLVVLALVVYAPLVSPTSATASSTASLTTAVSSAQNLMVPMGGTACPVFNELYAQSIGGYGYYGDPHRVIRYAESQSATGLNTAKVSWSSTRGVTITQVTIYTTDVATGQAGPMFTSAASAGSKSYDGSKLAVASVIVC